MAVKRAYYGNDRDLDYFERVFQSANINFLVGSGASLPAIRVLGNIEDELQKCLVEENEDKYFDMSSSFLSGIWVITDILLDRKRNNIPFPPDKLNDTEATKENYSNFLAALGEILTNRRTGLLPRRINIFTTNYDLFLEDAATKNNNIILNDGFSQRKNLFGQTIFDPKSFYRSIHATGNLYNYSVELPTINLIKLHGSMSWFKYNNDIYYHIQDLKPLNFETKEQEKDWVNNHALVLPRKEKFKQTVLENIYYDLLRTYSNELDKEGSLLIVFGFSFADEHIQLLTKKALRNATLKVIIFSYNEESVNVFMTIFQDYSNVEIVYLPNGNIGFSKLNQIIVGYLKGKI